MPLNRLVCLALIRCLMCGLRCGCRFEYLGLLAPQQDAQEGSIELEGKENTNSEQQEAVAAC